LHGEALSACFTAAHSWRRDLESSNVGFQQADAAHRRIRDRLGNRVQLIAITGWGRPEDQSRARAAGFDRHLRKPVDLHTLDAFIGSGA